METEVITTARNRIVQTAARLLEQQGYSATGLNQIIRESGSPKGSLYYYFPGGKQELAVEALRWVGAVVEQRIQDHLSRYNEPVQAISSFLRLIGESIQQTGFCSGGPLTTVALESAAVHPQLRETCEEIYLGWQECFASCLRRHGYEPNQAWLTAGTIVVVIEGATVRCRISHSIQPMEQAAECIGRIV